MRGDRILNAAVLMAFILICVAGCTESKQGRSTAEQHRSHPIKLFNGKDLTGWYSFVKGRGKNTDPKKVFTVQDGMIRISGEEYGSIVSTEEYTNYRLVVECKWGTKTYDPRKAAARDNGILIHSNGPDGGYDGTWMHSIECQIIEGGTGDLLVVGDDSKDFELTSSIAPNTSDGKYYQPDGIPVTINGGRINWYGRDPLWKDSLGYRGPQDVEKKTGEWNRVECIARDNTLTVLLNGIKVNEAWDIKPSKGRIQIQSEGAEMFVRTVEVFPF